MFKIDGFIHLAPFKVLPFVYTSMSHRLVSVGVKTNKIGP